MCCARAQPLLAFGIGWFFLQLLATNSVLQRDDLLSERNLYLLAISRARPTKFRIALSLDPDKPVAQNDLRAVWERGSDSPGVAAAK